MVIIISTIVIALIIVFSIYVYKESTEYHTVTYSFSDKRLLKDKVKIVFLTDLHNKQYGEKNCRVYDDIVKINPDYVMIGGDMITSCMEKWSDYSDTLEFVKNLSQKFKVIYGMGNHEERLRRRPEKFPEGTYEDLTARLEANGTPILVNECVHLDDGIDVYGIDLDHEYFRKVITRPIPDTYIEGKLGRPDPQKFSILLAHNPEHFESYAKWGANLVLSGHVHGGIIRLPFLGGVVSPALKLFPKYDGGHFKEYGSDMVLGRGLGSHTVPIRINNKAEIVVVELNKE